MCTIVLMRVSPRPCLLNVFVFYLSVDLTLVCLYLFDDSCVNKIQAIVSEKIAMEPPALPAGFGRSAQVKSHLLGLISVSIF